MTDEKDYGEPDFEKIKLGISEPRITPYILATTDGNNLKQAVQIYQCNIQLSEALYSSLHTFEITFRNRVNQALVNNYGLSWYQSEFFTDKDKDDIQDSIKNKKILKKDKEKFILLNEILDITNLNLGFWISLLNKKEYQQLIFNKCVKEIFPFAESKDRNFTTINNKLKDIRRLRNRVYNHEPIWSPKYKAKDKHETICLMIRWMCSETSIWLQSYDNFPKIYEQVSSVINKYP